MKYHGLNYYCGPRLSCATLLIWNFLFLSTMTLAIGGLLNSDLLLRISLHEWLLIRTASLACLVNASLNCPVISILNFGFSFWWHVIVCLYSTLSSDFPCSCLRCLVRRSENDFFDLFNLPHLGKYVVRFGWPPEKNENSIFKLEPTWKSPSICCSTLYKSKFKLSAK